MTTRRLRHLLYGNAAALLLAAPGVGLWLIGPPPNDLTGRGDVPGSAAPRAVSDAPRSPDLPDREALIALAGQPLRQQLFDPPPPPAQAAPPPPPLPAVELISTVLPSQGEPSAWVREPAQGNTPRNPRKVRVGDVLGPEDNPAIITAIEPDRLLVEHHGEVKPISRSDAASGGRR